VRDSPASARCFRVGECTRWPLSGSVPAGHRGAAPGAYGKPAVDTDKVII